MTVSYTNYSIYTTFACEPKFIISSTRADERRKYQSITAINKCKAWTAVGKGEGEPGPYKIPSAIEQASDYASPCSMGLSNRANNQQQQRTFSNDIYSSKVCLFHSKQEWVRCCVKLLYFVVQPAGGGDWCCLPPFWTTSSAHTSVLPLSHPALACIYVCMAHVIIQHRAVPFRGGCLILWAPHT